MQRSVVKRVTRSLIGALPREGKQPLLNRNFHQSHHVENQLIIGGMAVFGAAISARYAIAAYNIYLESRPAQPEVPEQEASANADTAAQDAPRHSAREEEPPRAEAQADAPAFSSWFSRNYYDGGFEEKMTRREAALVLGVRETATVERIKEAHRRVLLLNHPDRGGSVFLSAKINEAKDMLLKGRD